MKQTFEDFLMEKHAEEYVGTRDCMVDDFGEWLSCLRPGKLLDYGDKFAKEQSKGLIDIKAMVDRENDIYKTAYNLGYKEGYTKGGK